MPEISFKVILPRAKPLTPLKLENVKTEFRNFGTDAIKQLKSYPPKPPQSRYKRTYQLRRHWYKSSFKMESGDLVMRIDNDVIDEYGRPYAVWVQGRRRAAGPGQRALFARYGWLSVTDINQTVWPRYRNRILRAMRLKVGVRGVAVRGI